MVGVGIGLVLAAIAMAAAWRHNPGGEFHSAAGIEWGPWLTLGGLWAAVPTGAGLALTLAAGIAWRRAQRRSGGAAG
jgi:hypothetical protein